jgi:beta-glucanase (GH16 family)
MSTITSSPPPADPTVIWEEHFDGLDLSRWAPEYSTYGDGNDELQCYRPENVRVTGGRLVLTAVSESHTCPRGRHRNYTSGMVRSRGLSFSPGQAIEFRVKLTPADSTDQGGLWPAVWASSWGGGSWPRGGELDWLEVMTAEDPKRSVFSMHYANRSGNHELQNKAIPMATNFSDSWHTVRFEYGFGGRLTWYLDGQRVFFVDGADTLQGYPAPFDQTIGEIKINLALGGTPGPLSPSALGSSGATFEVDYIKVFAL